MAQAAAKSDIAALRRRIDALAAGRSTAPAPRLTLGPGPIDAALGGGLATDALHEASGPGAVAFAAVLAGRLAGTTVWIASRERPSRLFPSGLSGLGLRMENLMFVTTSSRETGWAFEQALRSGAARVVVAEGNAPPDFTTSRRLQLAAREGATLGLLLAPERFGTAAASAAETRWRVTPRPVQAPWSGPGYRLELIKNKKGSRGIWEIEWDGTTHCFHLAAAT